MTDRCVNMALSDAFGRFQCNRTLPTPFAFARWGLPCHFKRSGGDKWVHYTNAEYGCHREFSLELEWFWRWEPLSQWPLLVSRSNKPADLVASAAANPLDSAHPTPFPLETVFAKNKFKGYGRLSDKYRSAHVTTRCAWQ